MEVGKDAALDHLRPQGWWNSMAFPFTCSEVSVAVRPRTTWRGRVPCAVSKGFCDYLGPHPLGNHPSRTARSPHYCNIATCASNAAKRRLDKAWRCRGNARGACMATEQCLKEGPSQARHGQTHDSIACCRFFVPIRPPCSFYELPSANDCPRASNTASRRPETLDDPRRPPKRSQNNPQGHAGS